MRVWRLTGEYINTLGGIVAPWTLDVTRFPPDVKKVASFTTFKVSGRATGRAPRRARPLTPRGPQVWRGGYVDRFVPGQPEVDHLRDITEHELRTKTYGRAAPEPLLGRYFELPRRPDRQDRIVLDDSLPTVRRRGRRRRRRPPRPLTTGPAVADSPVLPPAHGVDGAGAAAAHARAGPRDAAEAEHPGGQEDAVRARGPLQASRGSLGRAPPQRRAQVSRPALHRRQLFLRLFRVIKRVAEIRLFHCRNKKRRYF